VGEGWVIGPRLGSGLSYYTLRQTDFRIYLISVWPATVCDTRVGILPLSAGRLLPCSTSSVQPETCFCYKLYFVARAPAGRACKPDVVDKGKILSFLPRACHWVAGATEIPLDWLFLAGWLQRRDSSFCGSLDKAANRRIRSNATNGHSWNSLRRRDFSSPGRDKLAKGCKSWE
jgi:hypothetical protein